MERRANEALRRINKWVKEQSLELATHKSKAVLFTNKYKIDDFKIEIDGVEKSGELSKTFGSENR